jgi:hypothetical protein
VALPDLNAPVVMGAINMEFSETGPQVEVSRSSNNQSTEDDVLENVDIVLALPIMPTNFLPLEIQPHDLDVVSPDQGLQDNLVQDQQVQSLELVEAPQQQNAIGNQAQQV